MSILVISENLNIILLMPCSGPPHIDCSIIPHRNHILEHAANPSDLEKLAYKVNRGSLALACVRPVPPLPSRADLPN
jgi:hypothetical protein